VIERDRERTSGMLRKNERSGQFSFFFLFELGVREKWERKDMARVESRVGQHKKRGRRKREEDES